MVMGKCFDGPVLWNKQSEVSLRRDPVYEDFRPLLYIASFNPSYSLSFYMMRCVQVEQQEL